MDGTFGLKWVNLLRPSSGCCMIEARIVCQYHNDKELYQNYNQNNGAVAMEGTYCLAWSLTVQQFQWCF